MSALEVVGLMVQLVGTGFAGEALLSDWREHRRGVPLIPAWARLRAWVRRRLGLAKPVYGVASGAVALAAASATGRAIRVLDPGASVDEQVLWLRERVDRMQDEVDELRLKGVQTRQELSHRIAAEAAGLRAEHAELSERLSEVATGRVRQELAGLGLVVIGTFLSALG